MGASQSQLGVEPVISAKDMVSENVDYIGVMAYAAWHQHVTKSGRCMSVLMMQILILILIIFYSA